MVRIDAANVSQYLRSRGVLGDEHAEVDVLDGGISNDVLGVRASGVDVVVKQALERLRVKDEWLAKPERILTEGHALELAGKLVPNSVPDVIDLDAEAGVLTIARAPAGWTSWKADLMQGRIDTDVARRLGLVLGTWHALTLDDPTVRSKFNDVEAFEQLRVDPYHRTVAHRVPEVREAVEALVDTMLSTTRCLVHGDFSPKNFLVGDDALWVIDWEVAHTGDPAFDVAFLLNHLLLKAIHRRQDAVRYRACTERFLEGYDGRAGIERVAGGERHVLAHLGCLLVARVDGKSPAEYLTPDEKTEVRALGMSVLLDRPDTIADVWGQVS